MGNFLETAQAIFQNLTAHTPAEPLHVGEVMHLWTYMGFLDEANRYTEAAMNMTQDEELLNMLRISLEDSNKQVEELREFFLKNGIPLPQMSEPKPTADPNDIPVGVRLTDREIADGLIKKLSSSFVICGTGLSQTIRTDVGALWLHCLMLRVKFSSVLIPMLRRRGWLTTPPAFYS